METVSEPSEIELTEGHEEHNRILTAQNENVLPQSVFIKYLICEISAVTSLLKLQPHDRIEVFVLLLLLKSLSLGDDTETYINCVSMQQVSNTETESSSISSSSHTWNDTGKQCT